MLSKLLSYLPWPRRDISYLESKANRIRLPADIQVRRRQVMAAVVDDQPFAPLQSLRGQGFEISYLGDISDPAQVAQYHIIVCDIRNVGTEYHRVQQGGALIEGIKKLYPQKYVIAYSGSFAVNKAVRSATENADARIAKSASISEWCSILDDGIRISLDPVLQWRRTRKQMEDAGISERDIGKIEKSYVNSILRGDSSLYRSQISKIDADNFTKGILQNLISSAIWTALSL